MSGCVEEVSLNPENVLQIKNVGLREGIFIRRYQLTSDYGNRQEYTPEILKSFIKEKLEQNYLFIANAYDLGLDKENDIQRKIKDFRVNLIASNHPIIFENLEISKDTLQTFYHKKAILYNIDLVQANSYSMADSMYKFLLAGNKVDPSDSDEDLHFPLYFQFNDLTYGEKLHPNLTKMLTEMKNGQVCRPVFTNPAWSIMRLNKKMENNDLISYDKMLNELIQQNQTILKFEAQTQLVNDLREKYGVSINQKHYSQMISAYIFKNNHGWIDIKKIDKSDLNDTFIKIDHDEISLFDFISSFNTSMQFAALPSLKNEDLDVFVEHYVSQNLLYLDGLEKGADRDKLIKDKFVNKEHRLLLTKYLNEEIGQKVKVIDSDAIEHYNINRDKWKAEYKVVEKSVKYDLRKILLTERKNELVDKLRKKYNVCYNEPLLKKLADQLTAGKRGKSKQKTVQ